MNIGNDSVADTMKTFDDVQSEFYPQLPNYFAKAIGDFVESLCKGA